MELFNDIINVTGLMFGTLYTIGALWSDDHINQIRYGVKAILFFILVLSPVILEIGVL